MSICWYCHWGWPKQVVEIYRRGASIAGEIAMEYGPAHIVWCDENFGDSSIKWCIENAEKYKIDMDDAELAAVLLSLQELLAVPENIRCCVPDDYDDANPERFPPPDGLVMGRI